MKRIFAAIAAFLMVIVLCACGAEEVAENQNTSAATTQPIEAPAYPTLLTYADYMKMTPEQQQAYYDTFPDMDTYMQWFNAAALAHNQGSSSGKEEVSGNEGQVTQPPQKEDTAETEPVTIPTQKPSAPTQAPSNPTQKPAEGTQKEDPEPLTYEEYLSLTPAQQQAYCESFSSMEAYMQWFNQAAEEYNKKNDAPQVEGNEGQVTQPTETQSNTEETQPKNDGDILDGYGTVGGRG